MSHWQTDGNNKSYSKHHTLHVKFLPNFLLNYHWSISTSLPWTHKFFLPHLRHSLWYFFPRALTSSAKYTCFPHLGHWSPPPKRPDPPPPFISGAAWAWARWDTFLKGENLSLKKIKNFHKQKNILHIYDSVEILSNSKLLCNFKIKNQFKFSQWWKKCILKTFN